VWAQNVHDADEGAFTGEISCRMLIDAGATGVLLGHSERRALFGETDEALARKLTAALAHGLEPVLCVGESEAERDGGATESRLRTQLEGGMAGLTSSQALQVTIAYEPVWAIGTGRSATPELAQETHAFIRGALSERHGEECAAAMRILYGGSVKPDNAASLLGQPDVDGALVGGASLDPQGFAAIARAALAG
jgi:triosephosphate isomerase (TIM)